MSVWIVGSNPSSKNNNPKLPFWGTKSYETLSKWLSFLGINKHGLINVSDEVTKGKVPKITNEDLFRLRTKLDGATQVIALGNTASLALNKLGIRHFKLPHPSGRNRLLNDKKLVDAKLAACKEWLLQK
jgi:uracil-DNA glycosylase